MPYYCHQVSYTKEAWARLMENPQDRLDAVRRQQFPHLGELAGIMGRDHELACDSAVHGPIKLRHGHFLQIHQPRHALARQRHQRQELVL